MIRLANLLKTLVLLAITLSVHAKEHFPLAPPDTSSPQATYLSFVSLVEEANQELSQLSTLPASERDVAKQSVYALFDKAIQCFDFSQIPQSSQQRVALESVMLMKEILDRVPLFDTSAIPDSTSLSQWSVPNTRLAIVKQADGRFLFSANTVENLYNNYQLVKHLPNHKGAVQDFYQYYSLSAGKLIPPPWFSLIEGMPDFLMKEFMDQAVWQWLALSALVASLVAYGVVVYRFVGNPILKPALMALGLWVVLYLADQQLNTTGNVMSVLTNSGELFIWLFMTQAAYLVGYRICALLMLSNKNQTNLRQSITQISGTLIGAILAVSIFGYGLSRLGVPVYGIVTGLSLGGMAIALAIRPTMENLLGGVILFMDKSLSVGDFCQIGKVAGTVERIGVRSTRVRAKDRTQITIANGDLIKMEIVNYSQRDRYPFTTQVGLRYETSMNQISKITQQIHEALSRHPDVMEAPLRVHFSSFGEYSLNLDILAHINTKDRNVYLELQQELLMTIDRIVKANQSDFAFPSQTTYLHMQREPLEEHQDKNALSV